MGKLYFKFSRQQNKIKYILALLNLQSSYLAIFQLYNQEAAFGSVKILFN